MMQIGATVILKSNNQKGIIADKWNPHLINPRLFKTNAPAGYRIITDDGVNHICIEEDFVENQGNY